jgi:dTDP-4-dehydrorhamnose reductase
MRILVTGSAGMLGRDLVPLLQGHDVRAIDIDDADLAEEEELSRALGNFNPEIILHLAAYTDVDGCERHPDRAHRNNAVATGNLARRAVADDALIVLVSTDYVFDGSALAPIPPDTERRPLSEYGRSKLEAEREVEKSGARSLIVRTSWLIGPGGRNFVEAIRNRAREGKPLRVVDDQRGSPTFTFDLAPALISLGLGGHTGVLHLTNQGECTWFELAAEILKLEGLEVPLEPTTTEEIGRPAPRPAYSVLDNSAANAILGRPLPPWREALARYLRLKPVEGA